jgi:hypothetical protein
MNNNVIFLLCLFLILVQRLRYFRKKKTAKSTEGLKHQSRKSCGPKQRKIARSAGQRRMELYLSIAAIILRFPGVRLKAQGAGRRQSAPRIISVQTKSALIT